MPTYQDWSPLYKAKANREALEQRKAELEQRDVANRIDMRQAEVQAQQVEDAKNNKLIDTYRDMLKGKLLPDQELEIHTQLNQLLGLMPPDPGKLQESKGYLLSIDSIANKNPEAAKQLFLQYNARFGSVAEQEKAVMARVAELSTKVDTKNKNIQLGQGFNAILQAGELKTVPEDKVEAFGSLINEPGGSGAAASIVSSAVSEKQAKRKKEDDKGVEQKRIADTVNAIVDKAQEFASIPGQTIMDRPVLNTYEFVTKAKQFADAFKTSWPEVSSQVDAIAASMENPLITKIVQEAMFYKSTPNLSSREKDDELKRLVTQLKQAVPGIAKKDLPPFLGDLLVLTD